MSKKGIFSTDSKAQLRHERSKNFAISMMIKKDMEENEREHRRFERQLERDLYDLDRKYGTSTNHSYSSTSTNYSYSNTHHRNTSSTDKKVSEPMVKWYISMTIALLGSSIFRMLFHSSPFWNLAYNISGMAAIATIGITCINNIANRKKGAKWRCLIVGVASYALMIWAQMIYPIQADEYCKLYPNHKVTSEYPSTMLIMLAGYMLGFTLFAALLANSFCDDKNDNKKAKKKNDIPDLLRTELDNQPKKVKTVSKAPAPVKTEPQKKKEPLVYKYYDNNDGHLGYWDLNNYFTEYDRLENLAREEEILINDGIPEEYNEQYRRNAEEYRKNMPEWARGKLSEEYAVEVINDTLKHRGE